MLPIHKKMQSVEQEASWSSDDYWDAKERCFLVAASLKSLQRPNRIGYNIVDSLEELGRLADTAGLEVKTRKTLFVSFSHLF